VKMSIGYLKEEEEAFSIGYLSQGFSGMKSCGKSRLICCDMKIYGTSLSLFVQIVATSIIFLGVKRENKREKKNHRSHAGCRIYSLYFFLIFLEIFRYIFVCPNLGHKTK